MSVPLIPTGDTKFYIGPAKVFSGTPLVASDFTTGSPVWTQVKGSTNLGTLGGGSEVIKSAQIDGNTVRKTLGPGDEGGMQVVFDRKPDDAGQIALIAAKVARKSYAFKIEFNDAPVDGTPSTRYFIGFVTTAAEELNTATNQIALNSAIEIDGNVVPVAAAEGD